MRTEWENWLESCAVVTNSKFMDTVERVTWKSFCISHCFWQADEVVIIERIYHGWNFYLGNKLFPT